MPDFRRPKRCCIICATPRSGSSFFARQMCRLPIGEPDEWLLREGMDFSRKEAGLPPDASFWDTLRAVISLKQDAEGRFALKIMWENLAWLFDLLRQEDPARSLLSDRELVDLLFPNAAFIYLYREDRLGQAVSCAKADQLDQWKSDDREKGYDPARLSFQFDAIYDRLLYLETSARGWNRFYEESGFPYLPVAYESFVADVEGELRRIADFLGLPAPRPGVAAEASSGPVRDAVNAEWKATYAAMRDRMDRHAEARSVRRVFPDECRAVLRFPEPVRQAHRGDAWIEPIEVTNAGTAVWPCVGYPDRKGSMVLACRMRTEAGEVLELRRVFFTKDVAPGETVSAEVPVLAPSAFGCFRLCVELEQWGWTKFVEHGVPAAELAIDVIPTWIERQWNHYFPAAKETTWGWRHDPVFGYLNTLQFPWLFHDELGWIFCSGTGGAGNDYWWWDWKLGLLWTSSKEFPRLYSFERQSWLEYERDSRDPRRFLDVASKAWIETERVG